ncbi:MAG: arginase family enzyme [Gammaproteobacteria bacterium]|jgi:arginase family enzyme
MDQGASEHADAQSLLRPTPSFLGAPIGDFEELRAGRVAMAGVFCDHFSNGQPGSRFAPRQLRYLGSNNPQRIRCDEDLIDIGDLNVFPLQPQRNAQILAEQSARIAASGAKLLAIGGDYSITPHLIEGLARTHPDKAIGVIRISRRVDFQCLDGHSTRANATRRINDLLGGRRSNILHIGAASPIAVEDLAISDIDSANTADSVGAIIITMHTLEGTANTRLEQALGQLSRQCDAVYLSVDADVLSPLYGETSLPRSARGLSPASVMALLDQLAGMTLLGADVMGHVPNLDLAGAASTSLMSSIVSRVADLLLGRAHVA